MYSIKRWSNFHKRTLQTCLHCYSPNHLSLCSPKCGRHNSNSIGLSNRISSFGGDGSSTTFGEWPHMCALLEKRGGSRNGFVCGASLIDEGVVLTAAQCVR